ncbi:MAG: hypothetical protein V4463_14755 [Pseudomonadota bacterium]
MSKHTAARREQQQRELQHLQQEAKKNQQQAEQAEVSGNHKNDGPKDHKGAVEGPRHK